MKKGPPACHRKPRFALPILVAVTAKQIGHDADFRIAGMVKAGQAKSGLHGFQQGEAVVVGLALDTGPAVVGFDGEDHPVLVLRGEQSVRRKRGVDSAVVVLIPYDDDRALSLLPHGRGVNGLDQPLDGNVALLDQTGIQTSLKAIRARITCAIGAFTALTVLVIALVGHDIGERREISGSQIGKQAAWPVKGNDIIDAVVPLIALLNALEVGERVVFYRIECGVLSS